MFRTLVFLSLATVSLLHAGVADHFKPALNKNGSHQMRNIDFIYVLNLDQRPEKFAKCAVQLGIYGIEPYRFSAVNGWMLTSETINDVGVRLEPWMDFEKNVDFHLDPPISYKKWGTYYEEDLVAKHEQVHVYGRNYFCHCMSKGAVGISLSHLSILQDAYDSGYDTIWVMEDDIDVVQTPHMLSDLIDELDQVVGKDGWDVFFTDPDTKNTRGEYVPSYGFAWRPNYYPANPDRFSKRSDINANIKKIGSRFGAYSMIVRRAGMKKILDFMKQYQIFLPYDIDFVFPPEIHLYSARTDIISTQPSAPSDNGAPNYENK